MAGIQSNFDLISSYSEPTFTIKKYQSNKTGMKLYHANVPLPLIKLEICVHTKPHDDTGCAHTLEHLIFLGSRKYPQHGYLDHIAAQYYSLGTNATTHKDMTTYELTTISHNSLAVLLPIFLDHVFNPLLKNDCYLTEVHHISGETGDDAGVVYSEMQSIENQPNEILALSIFRDLWSEKSLYHYESAGILESIRNELTLDKIKLFHSKFYIPNNVAIVLCGGGINIDEIVQLLTKFEEENFLRNENHQRISIDQCFNENQRKKAKFNDEKFPFIQIKRPSFDDNSLTSDTITKPNPISIDSKKLAVQTTTTDGNESSFCDSELMVSHEDLSAPPSPSSVLPTIETDNSTYQRNMNEYKEICYPVDDSNENLGQVAFGYRLESVYDIETYQALDVLLTTLSDDDISIFYKEFIEIPNTLCSTISHGWDDCPERVLTITFEGVEVDDLTIVADKYSSILYSIINCQVDNNNLYIQLQQNIKKMIQLHLDETENEPYGFLNDACCLDHISELSIPKSNDNEQHLHKFLQTTKYLESLNDRTIGYWHELIKKYLLEWDSSKRTVILLKPSNDLLLEQQEQEEQRIDQRLKSFGKNGLKRLTAEYNQARLNNKQSVSDCANLPYTPVVFNNQLHLPPIQYHSNENQIDLFHSPTSHFIKYVIHIPLKNLPEDLQLYLPLFSNLLFHSSIQYENIFLDKYQFCQVLSRDILDFGASNGQSSSSPIQSHHVFGYHIDTLIISMQSLANVDIYKNTIDYFRYILFGTIFNDAKIIREECDRNLKGLIEILQNGDTIRKAYFNGLIKVNDPKNYYHQMNIFLQKVLCEKVCDKSDKYLNETISKLELIKSFMIQNLSHMHLSICGNMDFVKQNWQIIEQFRSETQIKSRINIDNNKIKEIKKKFLPTLAPATIIGVPQEDSGYIMRWTHLPISPEDIVPLFIFANYLEMSNGPLWNACRTDGYCYGVAFDFDAETNLIILSINECSQIKLAYANALETLVNLVQRKTELDPKLINASRNLTICVLTENLATLGRAAHVCMNSYLDTYSIEKYKDFITELNSFTYNEEIMLKLIDKYVSPLVDNNQSSTLMLVNTNKMKDTQEFLQKKYAFKDVILIKDVVKHLCR